MRDEPVYAAIRETETLGWYWRVEVDVRDGHAWNGYANSYAEAVAMVHEKLRGGQKDPLESATARFVQVMEEYAERLQRGSKTLADVIRELDKARKGWANHSVAEPPQPMRPSPMANETRRKRR